MCAVCFTEVVKRLNHFNGNLDNFILSSLSTHMSCDVNSLFLRKACTHHLIKRNEQFSHHSALCRNIFSRMASIRLLVFHRPASPKKASYPSLVHFAPGFPSSFAKPFVEPSENAKSLPT